MHGLGSQDIPEGCGYTHEYVPYMALYWPKLCIHVYHAIVAM